MCGIAGYYSKKKRIEKDRFDEMVDIVAYRGPDDRGTYFEGNLAMGHRRLAIIDISSDGHQPFHYKDKYVLVYNGEIYNYLEIKAELEKEGYHFQTKTDTEVLIAAYDFWKEDCVQHFNGMWAFAVYDKDKNALFCSRDRFGVKPFYYYYTDDCFIFASEIKQILHVYGKKNRADKDILCKYLVGGQVDFYEQTMFRDIYQLQGGNNLEYSITDGSLKKYKYFDLRDTIRTNEDYKAATDEFKEKFINSVRLRLRSDVPVGYCLSGGLDSSAIVCTANKINNEREVKNEQHTISSCFDDAEYDEREYIAEVLNATDVTGHEVFPEFNVLVEKLDDMIFHMDEPFGSTSAFAQYCVFAEAQRQGLKVMLDGQGSDEQLAGYTPFYSALFVSYLRSFRFISFFREVKAYTALRAKTESFVNSKVIILQALAEAYAPYGVKNFARKVLKKEKINSPFSEKMLREFNKNNKIYSMKDSDSFIMDYMDYNLAGILHSEDRNSMMSSIETRVPFLDAELTKFVYGLPLEYKIKDGRTKRIMRDALKDIMPDKITNRYSKLGFVTCEDKWINNNPDWFKNELEKACDNLSDLLDKDRVMKWYNNLKGNYKRADFTLWRIICAGRWVKVFGVEV